MVCIPCYSGDSVNFFRKRPLRRSLGPFPPQLSHLSSLPARLPSAAAAVPILSIFCRLGDWHHLALELFYTRWRIGAYCFHCCSSLLPQGLSSDSSTSCTWSAVASSIIGESLTGTTHPRKVGNRDMILLYRYIPLESPSN